MTIENNKNKGYEEVSKIPRDNGKFVPKNKVPMKNLTVRLPIHVIEWIELEAEKKGLSKTDVAREIIQGQIALKTN